MTHIPTAPCKIDLVETPQSSAIETLRELGSPLEHIHPNLVAENFNAADRAYLNAVLEVIHESSPYAMRFIQPKGAGLNFLPIDIGANPETFQLPTIRGSVPIHDDVQATVFAAIHQISTCAVDALRAAIGNVVTSDQRTPVCVGIVPANCAGKIEVKNQRVYYAFVLAAKASYLGN